MIKKRSSGILLHLTSLPGKHGIGDFGPAAYKFIDFLAASGQSYWQFLPTGPTSTAFDNSPYMCRSVFAGNPLLISLELLQEDKFLSAGDLAEVPAFSEHVTDFSRVTAYKYILLKKAFENFLHSKPGIHFENFCQTHKKWLQDYALFMSLREKFKLTPWYEWPDFAARRTGKDFSQYTSEKKQELLYYKFVQFVFFRQWQKVFDYAHEKNISLIGDIPIYVALDSSDVWANQELFKIDPETLKPLKVAGVPPDYFSETGQRWGNPVYRWETAHNKNNEKLYDWWLDRFSQIFSIMDIAKIDHFRGFEAYWEIPGHEKTAVNGKWTKGPGKYFFNYMYEKLNGLPIIAEDLGVITPPVEKMRDELGFPGMKILHFAFESDEKNPYLPHNYDQTNSVVYTGTHDNNTTLGWFMGKKVSDETRNRIRKYLNSNDDKHIVKELTCLAMSSIARLAIIPMQDILGFGEDCRMNRPGTQSGNWRWRCSPDYINDEVARYLLDMTTFYNRSL